MIDLARLLIRRHGMPTVLDAEGAANAALNHFLTAASKGRSRKFETSKGFWQFTRFLIRRRLLHDYDQHRTAKRGGAGRGSHRSAGGRGGGAGVGLTREEADLGGLTLEDVDLDGLPSRVASHEAVVDGQMLVKRLVEALRDPSLRAIAWMKLEGCTNEEVAKSANQDVSTVKRKLHFIREEWKRLM